MSQEILSIEHRYWLSNSKARVAVFRSDEGFLSAQFSGDFGTVEMDLEFQDSDLFQILDELFDTNPDVFELPPAATLEIQGVKYIAPEVLDYFTFKGKIRSSDSPKALSLTFVHGMTGDEFAEKFNALHKLPYDSEYGMAVSRTHGYMDQHVIVDGVQFLIVDTTEGLGPIPFFAFDRTFSRVLGTASWGAISVIKSAKESRKEPWKARGREKVSSELGFVNLGPRKYFFAQWLVEEKYVFELFSDRSPESNPTALQAWIAEIRTLGASWPFGEWESNSFFMYPVFSDSLQDWVKSGGEYSREFEFKYFDTDMGSSVGRAKFSLKCSLNPVELNEMSGWLSQTPLFPGHA